MNDISLLTDEELNTKISEWCGFTNVHPVIVKNVKFHGDDRKCGITSDQGWIPDYCHSLDAMHKVEKLLDSEDQQRNYVCALVQLPWSSAWSFTDAAKAVTATARQRAEAFVLTMQP
jgi:hypothetical protein